MPLIPSDVGLRMRLDNEIQPQPVPPVQEIPSDLPRLQAGQAFSAQIRDVLPGNTYLALVAGKTVTLSLPQSAKNGDVLDLVVVEQTPKAIVAELANPSLGGVQPERAAYQHTRLSRTAQMLSPLLTDEGETPQPAVLNRGQPLLAQPPRTGAELVPVLSKAVTESGLFYEAHQAQWVAGKLPLRNLLQEPQGSHSMPASPASAAASATLAATPEGLMQAASPLPGLPSVKVSTASPSSTLPGSQAAVLLPEDAASASSAEESAQAGHSPRAGASPSSPASAAGVPPFASTPESLLGKAIAESLLLYQSNQAQGEALLGHPQSHLPGNQSAAAAAIPLAEGELLPPQVAELPKPAVGKEAVVTHEKLVDHGSTQLAQQLQQSQQASSSSNATLTIPDDLRALVQQQLDAAGSQRLMWHGEVWPGQSMQWQLEWQDRSGGNAGEGPDEPWITKLRLTTPRLGALEASLHLGVSGVRVAMATASTEGAARMRAASAQLESALEAAGVPLRGFAVRVVTPEEDATGRTDGVDGMDGEVGEAGS